MIKRSENSVIAGMMAMLCLLLFAVALISGLALWTDRSLDFWVSYASGTAKDVPYFLSWLATLLPVSFPFNVITEVLRLII